MILFSSKESCAVTSFEELSETYSLLRIIGECLSSLCIVLSPILLMIVLVYVVRLVLERIFVKKYGFNKK